MMSRRFSTRERVLLLILIIIFTIILYVLAVFNPSSTSINEAQNERLLLESELDIEMMKSGELSRMRTALAEMKESGIEYAAVPEYDNISNVAPLLNTALSNASEFDLRFMPVAFEGNYAMREISMSFVAHSYTLAEEIVDELSNGPYSCDISSLQIGSVDSESGSVMSGQVTVSLTIKYYELYQPVYEEIEYEGDYA